MRFRWLLTGFLSAFLLSSPARASQITSWHFDALRNQLEFSTDEEVQPQVQLLSNPARLVVDLPGVSLKRPKVRQPMGGLIREIRVGQFQPDQTRLVIELAAGYSLDPSQVKVRGTNPTDWIVQLPAPQPSSQLAPQPPIAILSPPLTLPPSTPLNLGDALPTGSPLAELYPQVQSVIRRYRSLQAGMFFVDLQTGNYLDIKGDRIFPAASTIKLPILVAFFQDVEAGKIRLNETLVMQEDLIASGSGDMQDMPVNSRFSALQTATLMITISDNTATNMIIERMGGLEKLNQRFRSWGLQDTVMHDWLGDFQGTNKTSAKDLVRLLALLVNGKLVSPSTQEQILGILRHTTVKTLLPAGIGRGATIANKTGDIGFLVGDAGVIDTPSGRRYLAGIFVLRPYDDPIVRDFVREISRLVYTHLDQPLTPAANTYIRP